MNAPSSALGAGGDLLDAAIISLEHLLGQLGQMRAGTPRFSLADLPLIRSALADAIAHRTALGIPRPDPARDHALAVRYEILLDSLGGRLPGELLVVPP
jgi:hypothetical protein